MKVQVKTIEVRDRMTFIPAIAMQFSYTMDTSRPLKLISRMGWYSGTVFLMQLTDESNLKIHSDPYGWDDRTMKTIHQYLEQNWEKVKDGDLLDVRVILGEEETPCESEL